MIDIPEQTLAKWRAQVELLLEGWRWCSCCGDVKIDPKLPSYAFKCYDCFKLWENSKGKGEIINVQQEGYMTKKDSHGTVRWQQSAEGLTKSCTACGDDIHPDRLRFAIFISGGRRECSKCHNCAKNMKQALNSTAPKKNQIYVPEHYMEHVADILPSYQPTLI